EDGERRSRFLREARAAAAVSHPNIAAVHEVGDADGRLYIAMERIEGESLRQKLGRAPLSIPEAVRIAGQVLRGLGKAHDVGLVHRDVKPANILIATDGVVKVLDFGLAKREEQGPSDGALAEAETLTHATRGGRLLGTPSYMSPEQARSVGVDRRSDL